MYVTTRFFLLASKSTSAKSLSPWNILGFIEKKYLGGLTPKGFYVHRSIIYREVNSIIRWIGFYAVYGVSSMENDNRKTARITSHRYFQPLYTTDTFRARLQILYCVSPIIRRIKLFFFAVKSVSERPINFSI